MVLYTVSGLGFEPNASMVTFPIDLFLVESDLTPLEARKHEFFDGLTTWKPTAKEIGLQNAPMISITSDDYEQAERRTNNLFLTNLWGDGLPLIPPTESRVKWILEGTDRARHDKLGKLMPRGGIVTTETVAVALAMAGGRPEYLPVLLATVDATLDPEFVHHQMQTTTGSSFPVVVVNGPIAKDIRLNSGFGLLGPDPQHPAGASIGRALRLILQNVGGALPGVGTLAVFGHMRYTNAVFAEDEEGLPDGWQPFGTERHGFKPGTNSISVFISTGGSNIMRRGAGKETLEQEAEESLYKVVRYLKTANIHYLRGYEEGTPGALMIPRVCAEQLAVLGWTKKKIKNFLWKHSALPKSEVERTGLKQWIELDVHPETIKTANLDPWPITRKPENLIILVAGGHHPTHNFWLQGCSRRVIGQEINLPKNWAKLLTQADTDLGCASDICLI